MPMKLFDKRPLCLACAAALVLAFAFIYAGIYAVIAAAVIAAVTGVVFIILKTKAKRTVLPVCAAVLVMCAAFSVYLIGLNAVPAGKTVHVVGYALPDGESSYIQVYNITKADGKVVNVKAVSYGDEELLPDFAEFEADVTLAAYEGYNEYYYKSKGVLFSAEVSSLTLTGKTHRSVSYYAGILRDFAAGCLYRVSDSAGILCRLFLGIKDDTPQSFLSDMRTLGVSHLLAVSGLHVTALLAGFDLVLTKIAGKSRAKYIILACIAIVYMAVTGFTGSVVRASLMYLLSRIALIIGRKNDPVTSLTVAGFVIVAVNPPSVYDIGFLLSFFAALGIIVMGAPLSVYTEEKLPSKIKFIKYMTSPVIITVSVLVFTLPVAAFSYGKMAYGAILYNIVTAPFAALLLYICPYLILFSYVPFLGRGLGLLADGLCTVMVKLVHLLAKRHVPSVSVSYPFVIPLVLVFIAAAVFLAVFSKKRLHYLCLALAFVIAFSSFAAIFSLTEANKTAIIVSKGKYGDYAAVLDRGKCTVFDFTSGSADGFYPLCEKLLSLGVTRADYVLAAEPQSRHLQSVIRVCTYFDIDNIYAPEEFADELSPFCGKDVIKTAGITQKYGKATLTAADETRFVSIGDIVYFDCLTENISGAKTVVAGSKTDIKADGVYYMKEYEKVLVIYTDE